MAQTTMLLEYITEDLASNENLDNTVFHRIDTVALCIEDFFGLIVLSYGGRRIG